MLPLCVIARMLLSLSKCEAIQGRGLWQPQGLKSAPRVSRAIGHKPSAIVISAIGHNYSCSGSSLPPPLLLVKVREATLELMPSLMATAFTVVVALRVKGSL